MRIVRRLSWFVVAFALALAPSTRSADLAAADAPDADLYNTGGSVEEDFDVQRQMRRAENFAEAGNYDRACEVVQEVAESEKGGTAVVAVGDRLFLNARERCHRLVASFPPSGLEVYRLRVDASARRLYEASLETMDVVGLRRVADLYLCSSWGDDALNRLGDVLLDQGDLRGAAGVWRRLLAGCPPEKGRSLAGVLTKYAAVSNLLGRSEEVTRSLRRLAEEYGETDVRLGGLTVAVADLGRDRLPKDSDVTSRSSDDLWSLPDGLRQRWRKTPRAYRPSAAIKSQHGIIAGQRRFLALPSVTAAVIDEVALVKDFNRLYAWDLRRTDRPLWLNAGENPEVSRASFQPNNWMQLHGIAYPPIHANYLDRGSQSIGVGEGLVVVTESNDYPWPRQNGMAIHPQNNAGYRVRNAVVAYASRSGKRRWELPGDDERLGDMRFVHAPTIDDGQALFPVVKGDMFGVLCVGAERGEFRWFAPVASHSLNGPLRASRDDAAAVAIDGTAAYVVTNTGFAAAIDRLDGAIRWIARVPRKFSTPPLSFNVASRNDLLATSDPIVHDGRLIVAPSDASHVVCLDAATGVEIWKAGVPNAVTHLVGIRGGKVVLAGRSLFAFDLDARGPTPEPVWTASVTDPVGRACLDDRYVYMPTASGIERFDLLDGASKGRVDLGRDDSALGNLVPYPGGLLVVNESSLMLYSSFSHDHTALTARIEENPLDSRSLFARALLCSDEGGEENLKQAFADLERARSLFAGGEVEPTERHAQEVRALLVDLYLATGGESAVEKAAGVAETESERALVALARAEVRVEAGRVVEAADALQAALKSSADVKIEEGGAIEPAARRVRRRLLELAADETHGAAVRAHFDEVATTAGATGVALADAYPAAGGAPDALLAAAETAMASDAGAAYDLAGRVLLDYAWSPAVVNARQLRERSMTERGLDPTPPRRVDPGVAFPLREIRSEEASGGALQGSTPSLVRFADGVTAGDAERVFFFLRSSDLGGEYVRCRDLETGATLWRGYANFGDQVPEQAVPGEDFLDRRFAIGISGDTICIGSIHGFSAFDLGKGSTGGRIQWQAAYGPGLKKLASEVNAKNVAARRGGRFVTNGAMASGSVELVPVPRPVIAHGVAVVVYGGESTAYLVDVRGHDEGKRLWHTAEKGSLLGEPIVVGDRLVATFGDPFEVHVRRLDDGKLEQRLAIGPGEPAGPAVLGPDRCLYAATHLGQLRRFDLVTGEEAWSTHVDTRVSRVVHADAERVVIETEDGEGIAFDAPSGRRLWRTPLAAPNASEQTIVIEADGGRLFSWSGVAADSARRQSLGNWAAFGAYSTSRIRGVDLATGKVEWTKDIAESTHIPGRMIATDGVVLATWAVQNQTMLLGLNGEGGEERQRTGVKHGRRPWARPDVTATAGTVLLSTGEGVRIYRSSTRGGSK